DVERRLAGVGVEAELDAQSCPPAQAYPRPPAYPPPQGHQAYREPDADPEDTQLSDLQGRPIPPAAVGPQATEPAAPAPRYGHASPAYPDEAAVPAPPGVYREPPQGYREVPPQGSHGYEPAAAGTRADFCVRPR